MKKLIILLIAILFQSCDIQKQATKQKNDIETNERIETKEVRKGDTVTYVVPNVIYKDTVITTVSTQGTILKTYYNDKGEISKSDCISSEIDLLRLELRNTIDQSKSKQSEKTESVDSTFIFVIGGALVLMFLILIIALFIFFSQQSKKFEAILGMINNK